MILFQSTHIIHVSLAKQTQQTFIEQTRKINIDGSDSEGIIFSMINAFMDTTKCIDIYSQRTYD